MPDYNNKSVANYTSNIHGILVPKRNDHPNMSAWWASRNGVRGHQSVPTPPFRREYYEAGVDYSRDADNDDKSEINRFLQERLGQPFPSEPAPRIRVLILSNLEVLELLKIDGLLLKTVCRDYNIIDLLHQPYVRVGMMYRADLLKYTHVWVRANASRDPDADRMAAPAYKLASLGVISTEIVRRILQLDTTAINTPDLAPAARLAAMQFTEEEVTGFLQLLRSQPTPITQKKPALCFKRARRRLGL